MNDSTNELHGLSLKEQTIFLWALCSYPDNPETCPTNIIPNLGKCPFEAKCEDLQQWAWLPILEKRVPPEENR